jgi:hypothetical protein
MTADPWGRGFQSAGPSIKQISRFDWTACPYAVPPSPVVNRFASPSPRSGWGFGCELKHHRSWALSLCEERRCSTQGDLRRNSRGARSRLPSGYGPISRNAGRMRDLAPPHLLQSSEPVKRRLCCANATQNHELKNSKVSNDLTPQSRLIISDRWVRANGVGAS